MDKCGNSSLVLIQKASYVLGKMWGKEVCLMETQTLIDGTMENHVRLIFDKRGEAL
jgi:hypothetical protein